MTARITRNDVVRYFANELDRARRREIESACRSDPEVERWFEELRPSAEEMPPVPEVRLDAPESRRLAVLTYLSVEREQVREWEEWIRNLVTAGATTSQPPGEIVPSELLEGAQGTLVYREPVPLNMAGAQDTFSVPPQKVVPFIEPDYVGGRLIIRQRLDRLPRGVVEVIVVRRRENEVETLPAVRIELEKTQPPEGEPYWYVEVPLQRLIGEFRPGDDFTYCVEAAPGA
jgi:hypothetical protein